MTDRNLPSPVTPNVMYLKAILEEITLIREHLGLDVEKDKETAVVDPATTIEQLKEDEPEPEGIPIPADFPGYEALVAAGIEYLDQVPRTKAYLVAVKGIGAKTADRILSVVEDY